MKNRRDKLFGIIYMSFFCISIFMVGCSNKKMPDNLAEAEDTQIQTGTEIMPEQNSEDFSESSEETEKTLETEQELFLVQDMMEFQKAAEKADILNAMQLAMEGIYTGFSIDASQISFEMDINIELKNLYYQIIAENPQLQYVYDITAEVKEGQLVCTFLYVPFKTGEFPEGFQGQDAGSLEELLRVAEENLDKDSVAIYITNPSLDVEAMKQALRQVGDGYFVCLLNADATEIKIQPSDMKYTREESLEYLAEISAMADEVIEKCITEDMTDKEKAYALYSYITDTVKYDQRYYTDRSSMPFASTTAYGAFHDGLAICGGYSYAIRILFTKAGIPCYLVSGEWGREGHLWNVAKIEDTWLYFDATADRGNKGNFRCFAVTADNLTNHSWESESIGPLLTSF